ncbi:hypothetical protein [Rhodovibrio salinarum]|uniref:Uncharacterized protein n=1 Tax=Rhodovibrio salinarum TaxID=1087 RepID=A0A934UYP1_9PROT|nr:hypothetical protein [Rhodovibrio salinarum]MBK1695744.1 hypothetical protein [Rhodovibrio salinarum]
MADTIIDQLAKGLKAATSLQITTVVGDFMVTVPENGAFKVTTQSPQDVKGIHTRIDLLQGDIGTIVDGSFYDPNQPSPLQALHSEQVANAQKIVQSNVELLGELAEWLGNSVNAALTKET